MQEPDATLVAENANLRFENAKLKAEVERLLEASDARVTKSRIEEARELLSAEELKELKLETGANWPPRTKPKEQEGYIFFQGPTPKTGVQADLPSFFAQENIAVAKAGISDLGLVPKALIGTAAFLGFVLFVILIIPTGPTPTYPDIPPPPAA